MKCFFKSRYRYSAYKTKQKNTYQVLPKKLILLHSNANKTISKWMITLMKKNCSYFPPSFFSLCFQFLEKNCFAWNFQFSFRTIFFKQKKWIQTQLIMFCWCKSAKAVAILIRKWHCNFLDKKTELHFFHECMTDTTFLSESNP